MNTPEEQWWMVRAGEYALGTLRGKDLELFEKILAHDTTLQAEVARWELHLAPLNEDAPLATPKSDLLPALLKRIREDCDPAEAITDEQNKEETPAMLSNSALDATADIHAVSPIDVRKNPGQSKLWPALTALATAACLVLSVLLFQKTINDSPASLNVDGLAVVLSDDSGVPFFLVETDYGNLKVRVTALSPPSLDDTQKFQLWQALPDRSGVRPVALLPAESGTARVVEVNALIDGSDLFGVSIEPIDNEPTDAGPTGPVVAHGDFLPKRDM